MNWMRYLLILSAALFAVPLSSLAGSPVAFTHGVASGDVTSNSAILWTRVNTATPLTVEVSQDTRFRNGVISKDIEALADSDFTVKVNVDGLEPQQTYFYRFTAGGRTSPIGTFRTALLPSTAAGIRLAWSSDSDGSLPFNNFEVLDRAREDNLDFWVYLGDTAYMDTNPPNPPVPIALDTMREKYKQNRQFQALQALLEATSMYVIWDDHEIRDNWNRETVDPAEFDNGRQAFQEYMPLSEWSSRVGFSRTFRWGKHLELFILDERSFRSASAAASCVNHANELDLLPTLPAAIRVQLGLSPTPPPGCLGAIQDGSRTMLGSLQKSLFEDALLRSDATWKIIVNEVPIAELFGIPYDRWEGYAAERHEVLNFIRSRGIKNVLFITGDLHANLITGVRRSSFTDPTPISEEFIAGPIAQATLFQSLVEILGSEAAANDFVTLITSVAPPDCLNLNTFAYGLIEIDETGHLTVTLKDDHGTAFCTKTLVPS